MDKQNKAQKQTQNRAQNNPQNKTSNKAQNNKNNWLKSLTDMRSPFDVQGSYTGVPYEITKYPIQDADDL